MTVATAESGAMESRDDGPPLGGRLNSEAWQNRRHGGDRLKSDSFGATLSAVLGAVLGALGGAIAVFVMQQAGVGFPPMAVPFATSIVLVMSMPDAEPAQPRALIGGHLLAALIGLIVAKTIGPTPLAGAIAVGLAMIAMHLTGTMHPPAGIDPLVVVTYNMSWTFVLAPVLIGAVALTLFALFWHNVMRRSAWPLRWWRRAAATRASRDEALDSFVVELDL
jgi:CBS-domain-containing membrane protein